MALLLAAVAAKAAERQPLFAFKKKTNINGEIDMEELTLMPVDGCETTNEDLYSPDGGSLPLFIFADDDDFEDDEDFDDEDDFEEEEDDFEDEDELDDDDDDDEDDYEEEDEDFDEDDEDVDYDDFED